MLRHGNRDVIFAIRIRTKLFDITRTTELGRAMLTLKQSVIISCGRGTTGFDTALVAT